MIIRQRSNDGVSKRPVEPRRFRPISLMYRSWASKDCAFPRGTPHDGTLPPHPRALRSGDQAPETIRSRWCDGQRGMATHEAIHIPSGVLFVEGCLGVRFGETAVWARLGPCCLSIAITSLMCCMCHLRSMKELASCSSCVGEPAVRNCAGFGYTAVHGMGIWVGQRNGL